MRELKESVHSNYAKLHTNYSQLECIITTQQEVITKLDTTIISQQWETSLALATKIETHTNNISIISRENQQLKQENGELKK